MALLLEAEKEKAVVVQVPKLSKPSIYHQVHLHSEVYCIVIIHTVPLSLSLSLPPLSSFSQSAVQVSQPVLTEAILMRHNQTEAPPVRPTFSGKLVTVNNRYDTHHARPTE